MEQLDKVIDIDQSPIGRTPRSNPATYTGVFDMIRDLFAATPDAKERGYKKEDLVLMSRVEDVKHVRVTVLLRLRCIFFLMCTCLVKSAAASVTIVKRLRLSIKARAYMTCLI